MLRKSTRQRKEYLYQKALEDKEKTVFENRKRLRDALENNKPLPTDLRNKSGDKLRKGLDLADDVTKGSVIFQNLSSGSRALHTFK